MTKATAFSSPTSGTLSHLTAEEERKLRQAWAHLLRLCGTDTEPKNAPQSDTKDLTNGHANGEVDGNTNSHVNGDANGQVSSQVNGVTKTARPGTPFRDSLWRFILGDNPDALVLRFLRARKWDVQASMDMLISAAQWRDEIRIDDHIIRDGEDVVLRDQPSTLDKEFVTQWRLGKSYVSGTDREGRVVYVVKVKLHNPSTQSAEAMERYILHSIESLRLVVKPPQDQACLVFDLTGFGLGNMDFHVVKFIVQVFEARYPETLGTVLVHNAPFVFWGIWNVVKRWLDPNVASKVAFTNGKSGLSRFIAEDTLAKEYGGKDTWTYKYVEPIPGENHRLGEAASDTREQLREQRWALVLRFEELTRQWVADGNKSEDREGVIKELHDCYWKLDPYIRARTHYHRTGTAHGVEAVHIESA